MWCKSFFHFLILASFSSLVAGQFLKFQDETPEAIKNPETVRRDWDKLESILKGFVNQGVKMLLPVVMDTMHSVNITSSCIKEAMQVFGGIRKLKPWAVRFIDSSAKTMDGMLTGITVSYGAYDECVETVAINQRAGKHKVEIMFPGKYCVLRVKLSLSPRKPFYKIEEVMDELQDVYKRGTILSKAAKYAHFLYDFPIRFGICVPSGCSTEDINQVFAKMENHTNMYMKVKRCEVKEEPKYTPVMVFVMSVYDLAGFVVLLGTLTDVYYYCSDRKPNRGLEYVKKMVQEFPLQVIMNGFLSVDTFFFLGVFLVCYCATKSIKLENRPFSIKVFILHRLWRGFLVCYCATKSIKLENRPFSIKVFILHRLWRGFLVCYCATKSIKLENRPFSIKVFILHRLWRGFLVCYCATKSIKLENSPFSIKVFILHRLWRILPVYIFVILYVFIGEITISGPVAHDSLQPFIEGCNENWWINFLFINYYGVTNMCLPYTYYISLDMQFYVGSLVILLPLFRYPKIGITIALTAIVGSMAAPAVVTYMKNFPPTLILANPNVKQISAVITEFYFKPYPHCGPYVIGMLTGYFLALKQHIRMPKIVQVFGWSCSIIFSVSVVYGTYEWNRGREPTFWETVLYSGCHRVALTLCVAWVVICCATRHGDKKDLVKNFMLAFLCLSVSLLQAKRFRMAE